MYNYENRSVYVVLGGETDTTFQAVTGVRSKAEEMVAILKEEGYDNAHYRWDYIPMTPLGTAPVV